MALCGRHQFRRSRRTNRYLKPGTGRGEALDFAGALFARAELLHTLLPGPEAQQLATYLGWLLGGPRGALIAGWLFVLPSYLSISLLSFLYLRYGQTPALEGFFFGLKCAVLSIVLEALLRVARRALVSISARALALASFMALFFLNPPFPLLIVGAGLLGYFAPLAFSSTPKNSALPEQT